MKDKSRSRNKKESPCLPEDGEAIAEVQDEQEDDASSGEISEQEEPVSGDEASPISEDDSIHSDMEEEDEDEDEDGLALENPHDDDEEYSEDGGLRIDVDQVIIKVFCNVRCRILCKIG